MAKKGTAGNDSVANGSPAADGAKPDGNVPAATIAEAETLKERGNELFRAGDMEGALRAYEAAISADPAPATYYANAAACCLRLDEPGRAALLAEEALRLAAHKLPFPTKMVARPLAE